MNNPEKLLNARKKTIQNLPPFDYRKAEDEGGCGVTGFISSIPVSGKNIFEPSIQMQNRGNSKGGGIAAAGFIAAELGVSEEVLNNDYMLHIALIDTEKLQTIQTFLSQMPGGYLVFLIVYTILYVATLIAQILISLKVVLPKESPESHVNTGDHQPKKLFFLHQTDSNGQITPSTPKYSALLEQMSEQDIVAEYVFELQKLSYIRKVKNDNLMEHTNKPL